MKDSTKLLEKIGLILLLAFLALLGVIVALPVLELLFRTVAAALIFFYALNIFDRLKNL